MFVVLLMHAAAPALSAPPVEVNPFGLNTPEAGGTQKIDQHGKNERNEEKNEVRLNDKTSSNVFQDGADRPPPPRIPQDPKGPLSGTYRHSGVQREGGPEYFSFGGENESRGPTNNGYFPVGLQQPNPGYFNRQEQFPPHRNQGNDSRASEEGAGRDQRRDNFPPLSDDLDPQRIKFGNNPGPDTRGGFDPRSRVPPTALKDSVFQGLIRSIPPVPAGPASRQGDNRVYGNTSLGDKSGFPSGRPVPDSFPQVPSGRGAVNDGLVDAYGSRSPYNVDRTNDMRGVYQTRGPPAKQGPNDRVDMLPEVLQVQNPYEARQVQNFHRGQVPDLVRGIGYPDSASSAEGFQAPGNRGSGSGNPYTSPNKESKLEDTRLQSPFNLKVPDARGSVYGFSRQLADREVPDRLYNQQQVSGGPPQQEDLLGQRLGETSEKAEDGASINFQQVRNRQSHPLFTGGMADILNNEGGASIRDTEHQFAPRSPHNLLQGGDRGDPRSGFAQTGPSSYNLQAALRSQQNRPAAGQGYPEFGGAEPRPNQAPGSPIYSPYSGSRHVTRPLNVLAESRDKYDTVPLGGQGSVNGYPDNFGGRNEEITRNIASRQDDVRSRSQQVLTRSEPFDVPPYYERESSDNSGNHGYTGGGGVESVRDGLQRFGGDLGRSSASDANDGYFIPGGGAGASFNLPTRTVGAKGSTFVPTPGSSKYVQAPFSQNAPYIPQDGFGYVSSSGAQDASAFLQGFPSSKNGGAVGGNSNHRVFSPYTPGGDKKVSMVKGREMLTDPVLSRRDGPGSDNTHIREDNSNQRPVTDGPPFPSQGGAIFLGKVPGSKRVAS